MNIPEYESYHEQKSHFDASFPYNTYLCSIPFDFTNVPLHWHDEVEFIYIKVGTGIITVDFQKYIVQGGDIAIIWPGQIHSIEQLHDQAMEYENIIFQTSLLGESVIDRSYAQFIKPLLDGHFSTPAILTNQSAAYATVRHCLDKNDNIGMSFPDGYPLAIKGNLFSLFFQTSCYIHWYNFPHMKEKLESTYFLCMFYTHLLKVFLHQLNLHIQKVLLFLHLPFFHQNQSFFYI